jgi:hypothetical protein
MPLLDLSFEQVEHLQRMEDKYPELKALKDTRAKLDFCAKRRDEIKREVDQLDGEINVKKRSLNKHEAIQEMMDWEASSGMKLERPDGPSFRRLRKAVQKSEVVYLGRAGFDEVPADYEKEVFRHAEVLVVEHNWAAAFQGATEDVAGAAVRLPYDVCAFEFKYSGEPVIALAVQVDTNILFTPSIHHDGRWFMFDILAPLDGLADDPDWVNNPVPILMDEISMQIKAVCIALDAEVAESETVRESFSGTNANNIQRPPKPYHIVSLARRTGRPEQFPSTGESGRRVRLHFRRGHWRHFEDHKTWIKWMLVGDPDLGFVEKHYRL